MPGVAMQTERGASGSGLIRLAGRLDSAAAGSVWTEALAFARSLGAGGLVVDASALEYCDSAGASLLLELRRVGDARFQGLGAETAQLIEMIEPAAAQPPAGHEAELGFVEQAGAATLKLLSDLHELVVFVGELTVMVVSALAHPRTIRFKDFFLVAEQAGIGAIPIVVLVGFLLGFILAFQSAIPMAQFGAQIFVADLIAISMLRELGPLLAAILLTARSGSAFAAELGTMKINEELDALTTMGLEPMRFLVVPRVLAALVIIPTLTMVTTVSGLIGGAAVFVYLGFPLVTYVNRVIDATKTADLLGGLAKSFVLGVIVAAVGCMRGIQTGSGAGAVGASTTSAVVTGIVLIAIAEGLFAVLFYVLGI